MDVNMLIALLEVLFCIVPLALVWAGTAVYDRLQRHKTHVSDNYRCGNCGHVFPVKGALISGFESHRYGMHINCTQCGSVIEQFVKTNIQAQSIEAH